MADFPERFFFLERVDIASNPLRFTHVEATLRTVKVTVVPAVIAVSIEIKPGSKIPTINLASAGVIPVAILSSPTFDAIQVDPASVSLSGASVKLVGKAGRYACSFQDVNGDGRVDLLCNVGTAAFFLEPGDAVAILEAKTFDGQAVRGQEAIRIVP